MTEKKNDNTIAQRVNEGEHLWYVGDPCYIIPDDEWGEFCEATFHKENQVKGYQHIDSEFEWRGQKLTIWSNGGDGTWTFPRLYDTVNGVKHFGVDAGIFCVIALHKLPQPWKDDPAGMGIIFDYEPELEVRDDVVFLNDEHDNSVMDCWKCGDMVSEWDTISCEFGNCDEGCWNCFECDCCTDCGETEYNCDCGEEE